VFTGCSKLAFILADKVCKKLAFVTHNKYHRGCRLVAMTKEITV